MNKPVESFLSVLTQAVNDFIEHGYTADLLEKWQRRLREAASLSMPAEGMANHIRQHLLTLFKREVEGRTILRRHPGVSLYTLDRLTPQMRLELDRRILVSVDLIRLNRDQAIEKTLQRFSGWATSIPTRTRAVERAEVKEHIGKALKQSRYEQRRLAIDQGHKLVSNINAVVAQELGAIAAKWRSHWKQPGYNYRADHKDRDGKVYAVRGSWAMQKGLVKRGEGYTDEMTEPCQEPFCRCFYVYLYNLRDLPDDMLTQKGRRVLEETRVR